MSENNHNQSRTNVSNRLMGSYQAQVVNVVHPDKLYMATVRLLGYWDSIPDKDLPYAEFLLPIGAKPDHGHVLPVESGDYVWVDFPRMGDTRYPRITGSLYYAPDYVSNLPPEVNGEVYEPKRYDGEPDPVAYDRKDYLYDRFGLREIRNHQGGYSLTHKPSGTAIEVLPDGKMVIHVEGDSFRSATGNTLEQMDGNLTINVKGNATLKVDGDTTVDTKGNATVKAGGNALVQAGGNAKMKGASVDIESDGVVNVKAGGAFNVKATNAAFTLG